MTATQTAAEWRRDNTDMAYWDYWNGETIIGYVHREGSRWFWSEASMDPRYFGRTETLSQGKDQVEEACRKRGLI